MRKKSIWRVAGGIFVTLFMLGSAALAKEPRGEVMSIATGASVTKLPDGRVLIAGGKSTNGVVESSLAFEDPVAGTITPLTSTLKFARAWHTATVLPDGTVMILGGIGIDGAVASSAELFDPQSETVQPIANALAPRAYHTTTVSTDGTVLIAGGVSSARRILNTLELWDPRTKQSTALTSHLAVPRRAHSASLLADGRILFSGGEDGEGQVIGQDEIYDPDSRTVQPVNPSALASTTTLNVATEVRASSPDDGAQNVPLNALLSVRFSSPVQMASINAQTVVFQGPNGIVDAKIVAAEGGMLTFLTPASNLLPGTSYSVQISGPADTVNQSVAFAQFVFTTEGDAVSSGTDPEAWWSPTPDWKTHRAPSQAESLPDLRAHTGTTALAGQVLRLDGQPLANVTLEIKEKRTRTDNTGRFLLEGIPAGHQVLVIDGSSANSSSKYYGRFEFGAEIQASKTNSLGFKIWMPLLDKAHEITIPSPTRTETVVTTPMIPGLELRIPPNTIITDYDGKPVTRISITAVPLDRPPFPLPFVKVPIYFTIQPGGAYIHVQGTSTYKGARLIYPNSEHQPAGVPFAFWNYSADQNGWYVYGNGHVSKNGLSVIPDPSVVIYEFTGAMVGSGNAGASTGNPIGDRARAGDPVRLSTGLFVYEKTDLALPDVIPIVLTRTYRPNDSWSRPFGTGASHPYEIFIGGNGQGFGSTPYIDLILADGSRVHFTGVGPGPTYSSYLHSAAGTPWYGAVISNTPVNPGGYSLPGAWQLVTRDGTIYSFPSSDGIVNPGCQALVGITDRYGNQLKITRNRDVNCTIAQITSPSGRFIAFTYDSSYRVKTATDNTGRSVSYNYDGSGRLSSVIDANNGTWTYGYDSLNRMTSIEDPRQITYLQNQYDSGGRVQLQTQADNSTYQFNWTPTSNTTNVTFTSNNGGSGPAPYSVMSFRNCSGCSEGFMPLVAQVDVIDPNGNTRRVVFNSYGYTSTDTSAFGTSLQETTTYTYYPDNLVASVTDQLGRVTSFDSYDALGNPTSITQLKGSPNAVASTLSYDGTFSNVMTYTDPLSHAWSFQYDTLGNLQTATDPMGNATTYTHNGMGRVTSVTDPLQNKTQFQYFLGDLTGIIDPLGNTSQIFLDGAGRMQTQIDPMGHVTKYQYNNLNQLTQITDPLQGITTLAYDPNGNPQSVQDARQQGTNNKTVYAYDSMDRLYTRTDPLLRQETYLYDSNGNLATFTDRRGKVTTLKYDALDRLYFAGYGTTAGPSYETTVNYSYDLGNRLQQIVDSASGTVTPVFDGLDRLISETTPQGAPSYQYDNASRRTSATVAGQPSTCYSYDNANRLTGIGQGTCPTSTNLVGFTYDNASRRQTMTLPNGIVLTYGYDNDSRINALTYKLGTNTVGNLTYQYDPAGRRTQMGGTLAASGFPAAVSSATYDVANELTNWAGSTISYDANGNMVGDNIHSYTWNARNQLSMIDSGSTASFTYDPLGRRTNRSVLGTATGFVYNGANVTQELAGSTVAANVLNGGIDEFFQRTDGGGTVAPLTDALGSVLALTNSSGTIQTQYTYDPFGNTTATGAASNSPSQYTGRENDGTGLYYYRARYYSPSFARFISEDKLREAAGLDFYSYVLDSPTNGRDPSGMSWTINLGGSGACGWGGNGNGGGGFVIDSSGNFGSYTEYGLGGAVGPGGCFLGLTLGLSNAHTICDFGGPFAEYTGSAGFGPSGSSSMFTGFNSDNTPIVGGSVTIGGGAGIDATLGATFTKVTPLFGRKTQCQ